MGNRGETASSGAAGPGAGRRASAGVGRTGAGLRTMRGLVGLLALTGAFAVEAAGQTPSSTFEVPTTNPRAMVRQRVAATDIEVKYSRPSVRGRTIFGALVPYGKVWRTGADAATKISFSTPVTLDGRAIEAGAYELFTIPGEREWVVILQPDRSQWGSYSYDPARDAARITARPVALGDPVQTLTISLDDLTTSAATLNISWDRIRVPVRIAVDVRTTVVPQLEAALRAEGRRPYFQAAMFYFENDLDIDRAAELMALAVEANPTHIGMLYRQALILERKGDRAGAIAAAERSLAGAASAAPELRDEYTRLNAALLARLRQAPGASGADD